MTLAGNCVGVSSDLNTPIFATLFSLSTSAGKRHIAPMLLHRHVVIDGDRSDRKLRHQFEAFVAQGRIVAAVVADLIEDRARQKVRPGNGAIIEAPLQILPR